VRHLSGAPLYGRLLALPTNIRLGWKGLLGTNALSYNEEASLTGVIFYSIVHCTHELDIES
jgi:hypothetical protein